MKRRERDYERDWRAKSQDYCNTDKGDNDTNWRSPARGRSREHDWAGGGGFHSRRETTRDWRETRKDVDSCTNWRDHTNGNNVTGRRESWPKPQGGADDDTNWRDRPHTRKETNIGRAVENDFGPSSECEDWRQAARNPDKGDDRETDNCSGRGDQEGTCMADMFSETTEEDLDEREDSVDEETDWETGQPPECTERLVWREVKLGDYRHVEFTGQQGRGGKQGSLRDETPRNRRIEDESGVQNEERDTDKSTIQGSASFTSLISELPDEDTAELITTLVKCDSLPLDDTIRVLQMFQACIAGLKREDVLNTLQTICTSRFLDKHLLFLLNRLETAPEPSATPTMDVVKIVEMIHVLITNIYQTLPSYASRCTLLVVHLRQARNIMSVLRNRKPELEDDLADLQGECENCTSMVQNQKRRAPRNLEPREDVGPPPESFTSIPILPDASDLDSTIKPYLRPNKATGAYKDAGHYLDVQFRLLREDYIRPLRDGLKEYKQKRNTGGMKKCKDLRIYHSVQITGIRCGDSIEHVIKFDVSRLPRVHWQTSKRLPYGALLCLSQDDFETIHFAVVTKRDTSDLADGVLRVKFENSLQELLGVSEKNVFIMAESPAFFEAYRHVLEALQMKMSAPFPMERYIVECQKLVIEPRYLQKSSTFNLSSVIGVDQNYDASEVPVLELDKWPPLSATELDKSQYEALKNALTKNLAIIQGPPGTGKTYVGLKITQVLLDNRDLWTQPDHRRPILVVCYTNHALDQFLEGIVNICPKGVIRVGSRSKNADLEQFNLKKIKRTAPSSESLADAIQTTSGDVYRLQKQIEDYTSQTASIDNHQVLSLGDLKEQMLPEQLASLQEGKRYIKEDRLMKEWLVLGAIAVSHSEETDPYTLLAEKVKLHILGGNDTLAEDKVDPTTVHSLSYQDRARLYRFWQNQIEKQMQQRITDILPDEALKKVMNRKLYDAITVPMLQDLRKEKNCCVRAWLGIHPTSRELITKILSGGKAFTDEQIPPGGVLSIIRRIRVQLYRHWLMKVLQQQTELIAKGKWRGRIPLQAVERLKAALTGILPDSALTQVMNKALFNAIQERMSERHAVQQRYIIRAWLGIAEFAKDLNALEKVLGTLTGKRQDNQIIRASNADDDGREGKEDVTQTRNKLDDTDIDKLIAEAKQLINSIRTGSARSGWKVVTARGRNRSVDEDDDDEWTVPNSVRQFQEQELERALRTSNSMTLDEASCVVNLWDAKLTVRDRVRLYLLWVQKYRPALKGYLQRSGEEYAKTSKYYQDLKSEQDIEVLKDAVVIGMTTTRAARYHKVLERVGCPIVILEEAAEVLEAHVVTTLHESCQHLILIGDHQQLRPSPTVYELCRHYHLDLSLFERLVNNNLPHSTLAVQHRMRPEVSRLVRHVYPHLEDHEVTFDRDHIRGMKEDVFFFHHEVSENAHGETSSKYNEHEADMILQLCRYLILQGYPPSSITVLAAYTGQVLKLKSIMQGRTFWGLQITSVDNYQGEENDVIILSLVRSNEEGSVGFLGTDNRVCVALSRARNGLYAFGNFKILTERSRLWRKVVATATQNDQTGQAIVLRCENHPETEIHATHPRDFRDAPEGGCTRPCDVTLDCGHKCRLLCHGYDRKHVSYKCQGKCERKICKLDLHPCPKKCFETCNRCLVEVEKIIPVCGHIAMIECGTEPNRWMCEKPCEHVLPCGHRCSGKCGDCSTKRDHVTECKVEVERTWQCGHLVKSRCHLKPGELPCKHPCGARLDCGHDCPGTCGQCLSGRVHVACKMPCGKILEGCGHKCTLPCGSQCLPCNKKCRNFCKHGDCSHECGKLCQPCSEPCPKECEHKPCRGTCDEPCQPCSQLCSKQLKCGHKCRGSCGEMCVCAVCDRKKLVRLAPEFLRQVAGNDGTDLSENLGDETDTIPTGNSRVEGRDGNPSRVDSGSDGECCGGSQAKDTAGEDGEGTDSRDEEAGQENSSTGHGLIDTATPTTDTEDEAGESRDSQDTGAGLESSEACQGNHDAKRPQMAVPDDDIPSRGVEDNGADQGDFKPDEHRPTKDTPDTAAEAILIKLPRCGHVFRVEELDSYVETKLATLPPGRALTCPAPDCGKPVSDWGCWRYSNRLRKRHSAQQKAKEELKRRTTVHTDRQSKIKKSISLLQDYAKEDALRRNIGTEMNVNLADVLTNKCKMLWVLKRVRKLFDVFPVDENRTQTIVGNVDALETVLLQPMKSMSNQRYRELWRETQRLTFMTLLTCAQQLSTNNENRSQRIDSCFTVLEGQKVSDRLPLIDMDEILAECKEESDRWDTTVGHEVLLAMLYSRREEELCDIEKSTRDRRERYEPSMSVGCKARLPPTLQELRNTSATTTTTTTAEPIVRRRAIHMTRTSRRPGGTKFNGIRLYLAASSDASESSDVTDSDES